MQSAAKDEIRKRYQRELSANAANEESLLDTFLDDLEGHLDCAERDDNDAVTGFVDTLVERMIAAAIRTAIPDRPAGDGDQVNVPGQEGALETPKTKHGGHAGNPHKWV